MEHYQKIVLIQLKNRKFHLFWVVINKILIWLQNIVQLTNFVVELIKYV